MRRRHLTLIPIILMVVVLLSASATPAVAEVKEPPSFYVEITDYPETIKPGGSYDITVKVTRPENMELPYWKTGDQPKWEVRVYFYSGLKCYNDGDITTIDTTELYDGWWKYRKQGDSWTKDMNDTRTFKISVDVVDRPRDQEDIDYGMNEIPVGDTIRLKARVRLRGMDYTAGENTFTYAGQTFGASTATKVKDDPLTYKLGSVYIEKSEAGYWQIDYDKRETVSVAEAEAGLGVPIWVLGVIGVVVVVIIIAIIAVKRGGGEEIPVEPAPGY